MYKQFTSNYESRDLIYKRKMFIRLITGGRKLFYKIR